MASTSPGTSLAPSMVDDANAGRHAFARFAWGVLVYTVGVVLFGAVVRITGSGAGCGQHWPTCQGEVVHVPKTLATAIELTHRLTSGVSLVLVVLVAVSAFRRFPKGHATRYAAAAGVFFMLTESLVGAALVLFGLVGKDHSVAHAVVIAIHLVNTSFLAAAVTLTAWTATRETQTRMFPIRPLEWSLLTALGAVLLVSISGAVTALGDTLYPVEASGSLAERLAHDQSGAASFLERGRAVHPGLAFVTAVFVLVVAWKTLEALPGSDVARAARRVLALVFVQVAAGVLNIFLSAPGYMQVAHLAIATTLWLSLVVLYATALAQNGSAGSAVERSPPASFTGDL